MFWYYSRVHERDLPMISVWPNRQHVLNRPAGCSEKIHHGFTEAFDTSDLTEATRLLKELSH
jgi:hypothetical protein